MMRKSLTMALTLLGCALAHGGHVEMHGAALQKTTGGYVLVAQFSYHEQQAVKVQSVVVGGVGGVLQQKTSTGYQTIKSIPLKNQNTRLGARTTYRVLFKTLPKNQKLYLTVLMSGNVLGQEVKVLK